MAARQTAAQAFRFLHREHGWMGMRDMGDPERVEECEQVEIGGGMI
jgi:hypothetical protein